MPVRNSSSLFSPDALRSQSSQGALGSHRKPRSPLAATGLAAALAAGLLLLWLALCSIPALGASTGGTLTTGHSLGVHIEGVHGLAGRHEQPVPVPAAKA